MARNCVCGFAKLKQVETRVGGFCWVLASDVKEVRGNGGSGS